MGSVSISSSSTRRENHATDGDAPNLTLIADIAMSASYTPGGDLFDVSGTLASKCYGVTQAGRISVGDTKWMFEVSLGFLANPSQIRIRAFDLTTGAEATAGADLHLEEIRLMAEGV